MRLCQLWLHAECIERREPIASRPLLQPLKQRLGHPLVVVASQQGNDFGTKGVLLKKSEMEAGKIEIPPT